MACEGCIWKGKGAIVIPEYSRENGTWDYRKTNTSFPPCELQEDVFAELRSMVNFAGRVLTLTGHDNRRNDVQVIHRYGTDGILIQHGTCVGRSVTE